MILFAVTRYCRNYISAIALSLPLVILAGCYGTFFILDFAEITRGKYMAPMISAVVLGLGVALFFPGTISEWWPVNLLWFVLKCLGLMLVSLTLVKSATGRFRIDQAFRFYVTVPTALALCSLILVWVM